MVFHRRMVAPIVSIKHYVTIENSVTADGVNRSIEVVQAVTQPGVTNTGDVVEGSIIKAIYLELWYKGNASAGTESKFQFAFEKVPAGQSPLTFVQMNNLMTYPNKKNVLFVSQGVVGDLTTQSIPVVRNWIKIPKGKQRMGLDDKFQIAITTTGATSNTCGVAVFKEYK